MMKRAGFALAAVLLALGATAWADKPSKKVLDEAKIEYSEGQKLYSIGDFAGAIEHYTRAYKLVPKPALIFNIAQAHRLARDHEKAIFFYESFLRAAPEAANRAEVEQRIAEQRAALASSAAKPPVTEPPPTDPPPDEPVPDQPPVPIVSPDKVAELTEPPASQDPELTTDRGGAARPIYKRWWFWAGVGAVAAGATAVVLLSSGGGADEPDTHFGIRAF